MAASLLILGAGGHGKVVADAAIATGAWKRIAFLDSQWQCQNRTLGLEILGADDTMEHLHPEFSDLLVALGDNDRRLELLDHALSLGFILPVLCHPNASVSPTARIGEGTVVFAQATVNPDAEIGRGAIVNTGAIVEHDCSIGNGGQVSPGACMGGWARLGERASLGINASVLPKVSVGDRTTVGAGAVVIQNLPNDVIAYGVPAKIQDRIQ